MPAASFRRGNALPADAHRIDSSQPVLGVPSRMNVGHRSSECLMGWALLHLVAASRWCPFRRMHATKPQEHCSGSHLEEAAAQPGKRLGLTTPKYPARSSWWSGPHRANPFDRPVTVAMAHKSFKTVHLVERQDPARSIRSYSLRHPAPWRQGAAGRTALGDGGLGLWMAYGRCYTPAKDCSRVNPTNCRARNEALKRQSSKASQFPFPGQPESFQVLRRDPAVLGLDYRCLHR